jgi:uncharacterized protein (UPF0147 family)
VAGYGNFDKKDKSPKTWQVMETLIKKRQVPRNVAGSGNFDKKKRAAER